jgi:hypothetical protein
MSPSTSRLPSMQYSKRTAVEGTTYQVEAEKDEQAVGVSTGSLLTAKDEEKPSTAGCDGSAAIEEKLAEEPARPVAYPKGLELFFLMLALVLSITLVALDQVRFLQLSGGLGHCQRIILTSSI